MYLSISFPNNVYSDLPLETWTDLFGFLPRSQLLEIVSHIADRQFAKFVQFFLHECGQITLGELHIKSSSDENEPAIVKSNNRDVPLATVPIPENIKNFTKITLRLNFANKIYYALKTMIFLNV
jgi:thioredoxin-related protein